VESFSELSEKTIGSPTKKDSSGKKIKNLARKSGFIRHGSISDKYSSASNRMRMSVVANKKVFRSSMVGKSDPLAKKDNFTRLGSIRYSISSFKKKVEVSKDKKNPKSLKPTEINSLQVNKAEDPPTASFQVTALELNEKWKEMDPSTGSGPNIIPPASLLKEHYDHKSQYSKSIRTDSSSNHNSYTSREKKKPAKERKSDGVKPSISISRQQSIKNQKDSNSKKKGSVIASPIQIGVLEIRTPGGTSKKSRQHAASVCVTHNKDADVKKDILESIKTHKAFVRFKKDMTDKDLEKFDMEEFLENLVKTTELEKRMRARGMGDSGKSKLNMCSGLNFSEMLNILGDKVKAPGLQAPGQSPGQKTSFLQTVKLAYRTLGKTKNDQLFNKKWEKMNDDELRKKKMLAAHARQEKYLISLSEIEEKIRMKRIMQNMPKSVKNSKAKTTQVINDGGPFFRKNMRIIKNLQKQQKKSNGGDEVKEEIKKNILKYLVKSHNIYDYEEFITHDNKLNPPGKGLMKKIQESYQVAVKEVAKEKSRMEANR
jgi:hypothetical protein